MTYNPLPEALHSQRSTLYVSDMVCLNYFGNTSILDVPASMFHTLADRCDDCICERFPRLDVSGPQPNVRFESLFGVEDCPKIHKQCRH
jgi:hypothetical protein